MKQQNNKEKGQMRKNKQSFTLIELLVGSAIIAILAGMLLPALNNARDRARMIACTNNMKQLGIAMGMYTTQYEDCFPYVGVYTVSGTVCYPMSVLAHFTGLGGKVFTCPSFRVNNSADITIQKIQSFSPQYLGEKLTNGASEMTYTHYGINRITYNTGLGITGKITRVKMPSRYLNLGESTYNDQRDRGYAILGENYYETGAWGLVDIRHNTFSNVLFADGHVDALNTNMKISRYVYTSSLNPYRSAAFTGNSTVGLWNATLTVF